jgi:Arc/MetJ-type ribon-helix-helix transcriptional regulator
MEWGVNKMQRITIRLPEQQLKKIDLMVDFGDFPSASEAIRTAIREFIDQRNDKLLRNLQLMEQMETTSTTSTI